MESKGLTWVLVDGHPAHVSQFAAMPPRRRPHAICPLCGRRLTLKLGRVRRHHAAHAPHDHCAATQPETALHLDVKLHLASRLAAAISRDVPPTLRIRRRCAGGAAPGAGESCDGTQEDAWMRDWDDVVVETRVRDGRIRPDLLLMRQGATVAAIEVLVSHAVSDEKAAALAAVAVPWIEVRAAVELLEGESAWNVDRPLLVERAAMPFVQAGHPERREGSVVDHLQSYGPWRCPRHDQAFRAWAAETAVRRAAEQESSRHTFVLLAARVVDVYHAAGARDRAIYRVDEHLLDGIVRSLTLRRGAGGGSEGGGRGGLEIANEPAGDSRESKRAAWAALRSACVADVERLESNGAAFADSPMRWATGDAAENLVDEALSDLVPGDPTPLATRYPRRWFYAPARGQWFLPRDMRGVRWDRAAPDVFAAHPAWAASRSAVRERPAPPDAWSTFVFASRPSVSGRGVRVTERGPIAQLEIVENDIVQPLVRRVLVVLTAAAPEDEVRRVAQSLAVAGVEQLWLSHPRDWTSSRADLAWAPAGRDGRGRGVVVVDGLGVFRAEQFVRLFARGDRRLRPEAIRAKLAERVALLGGAI